MRANIRAVELAFGNSTRTLLFSACLLLASLFGCQAAHCPGSYPGDFDDSTPQGLCTLDKIVFSPQKIDSSNLPAETTPAATTGGQESVSYPQVSVSVLVFQDSQEPRTLANLDICQCDGNTEKKAKGIVLKGAGAALEVGGCIEVSSTRIHCLTNYEGRAVFAIQVAKSERGQICGDCSDFGSADGGIRPQARLDIVSSNSDGGVDGSSDAAPAGSDDLLDAGAAP